MAGHLSGSAPTGLIVYLHGDGYGEFSPSSTVLQEYAAVAREQGMLLVAPVTPDRTTSTWWRNQSSGDWLRAFLQHIQAGYRIDHAQVWFVGYSGGAEVITNVVVPQHSDLFTGGGALMIGGGSYGQRAASSSSVLVSHHQTFQMTWLVGELDTPSRGGDGGFDALGEARRAESGFRQQGMTRTTLTVVPGENHITSVHRGAAELRQMLSTR
ncbi:MAG: hypothetical protein Q4G45_05970 [Actinomycetia bacterium]|nr:hypothetical protein [Actinomycetes bacterium]